MAAYLTASLPLIVPFRFTMKLSIRGASSGAVEGRAIFAVKKRANEPMSRQDRQALQ